MDQNRRRNFLKNGFLGSFLFSVSFPQGLDHLLERTALKKEYNQSSRDDLARIKEGLANMGKPLKWVFTGDSITQGAKHTLGFRSFPEIFSEHIRFEMNRSRDIIINTAVSGNASIDILDDFQWRVEQFKPDIVLIMAGTNDAAKVRNISAVAFEGNMRSLIQRTRTLGAIPVLNTPPPILQDGSKSSLDRGAIQEYIQAIHAVATKEEVLLVDHHEGWLKNYPGQEQHKLMNDALHPNGRGHLAMARGLFEYFDICQSGSFTCNGKVNF